MELTIVTGDIKELKGEENRETHETK